MCSYFLFVKFDQNQPKHAGCILKEFWDHFAFHTSWFPPSLVIFFSMTTGSAYYVCLFIAVLSLNFWSSTIGLLLFRKVGTCRMCWSGALRNQFGCHFSWPIKYMCVADIATSLELWFCKDTLLSKVAWSTRAGANRTSNPKTRNKEQWCNRFFYFLGGLVCTQFVSMKHSLICKHAMYWFFSWIFICFK